MVDIPQTVEVVQKKAYSMYVEIFTLGVSTEQVKEVVEDILNDSFGEENYITHTITEDVERSDVLEAIEELDKLDTAFEDRVSNEGV